MMSPESLYAAPPRLAVGGPALRAWASTAVALVLLAMAATPAAALTVLPSSDDPRHGTSPDQEVLDRVNEETGYALLPPPAAVPAPGPTDLASHGPGVLAWGALAGLGVAGGVLLGARYVTSRNVLGNPVRRELLEEIRRSDGTTLRDLVASLGLSTTNALWHLRKLVEAGLVGERKFHGLKVYYAREGGVAARDRCLQKMVLANDNAKGVFDFIASHPGVHQREISRALALNHGTVRWHLSKLESVGLLALVRLGRTAVYFSSDRGAERLVAPAAGPLAQMG